MIDQNRASTPTLVNEIDQSLMAVEGRAAFQIAVAQLGARMHYAVPRILHEADMLHRLYTDICAVKGWPRVLQTIPERYLPTAFRRLSDRVPAEIPRNLITTYNTFGVQYAFRRYRGQSKGDATRTKIWAGREFTERVIRSGLNGAEGVYTFNVHGFELLRAAREGGLVGLVEQTIAPKGIERRLIAEEIAQFPKWEDPPAENPYIEQLAKRERAEWNEASVVLCGSEFVRDSIAVCGGPVEKCRVVPYGVDMNSFTSSRNGLADSVSRPIRVLTVGNVGLRKGSPYVLEAAELLGQKAEVRIVGGVAVSDYAVEELSKAVDLRGRVPRSEVADHYEWADVFLLPSICEGSATVTYEAMAHNLPVICTPNTGSIIRDGKEGFIVPIRDAEAIVDRIIQLSEGEDLYRYMAESARNRAVTYGSLEAYGKRLIASV